MLFYARYCCELCFEKGMVKIMKKDIKKYEPPSMKVYRFTDQDKVLTASGTASPPEGGGSEGGGSTTEPSTSTPSSTTPTPNYAANALNEFMGGTNTTIE